MSDDDLTRRAIIAAHNTSCPGRCGHVVATYPNLTKREQAIVAAWRADVETTSVVHECCEARQSAETAIQRARYVINSHLHRDAGGITWVEIPVAALHRALDGTETTDG